MNFSEYCKKRDAELNESVYTTAPFTDKYVPRKSKLNVAGLVRSQTGSDPAGEESALSRLKEIGKTASIFFWTPSTIKWAVKNLPKASKWTAEQIKELKRMEMKNRRRLKDDEQST